MPNNISTKVKLFPIRTFLLAGILLVMSFIVTWGYLLKDINNYSNNASSFNFASIGHSVIKLEVASTSELRVRGLGGRDMMSPNEGMLFVFDSSGIYSFWMKDMRFPIDIFWINAEEKVVFIKRNATPESFPETFTPDVPAKFVVETVSGFSIKNDVKNGDKIYFFR